LRLAIIHKLTRTSSFQEEREKTLTFNSIPLQAVLVRDLSKAVLDDRGQRIVVEMVVVDLGSKVELPLGLEFVV
jgi:hypothetical protein